MAGVAAGVLVVVRGACEGRSRGRRRRRRRRVGVGRLAASTGAKTLDAIANISVLGAGERTFLAQLHFEINHFVAKVVELRLELIGAGGVACARLVTSVPA